MTNRYDNVDPKREREARKAERQAARKATQDANKAARKLRKETKQSIRQQNLDNRLINSQFRAGKHDRVAENRERDWQNLVDAVNATASGVGDVLLGGKDVLLNAENLFASTADKITDKTGDVLMKGAEVAGGTIKGVADAAGGAVTGTAEALSLPLIIGGLLAAYILTQTNLIK